MNPPQKLVVYWIYCECNTTWNPHSFHSKIRHTLLHCTLFYTADEIKILFILLFIWRIMIRIWTATLLYIAKKTCGNTVKGNLLSLVSCKQKIWKNEFQIPDPVNLIMTKLGLCLSADLRDLISAYDILRKS